MSKEITDEARAADRAILAARTEQEPKSTPADISSLAELESFRGKAVKYTRDGGETWHYAWLWDYKPVHFSNGSFGYLTDDELMPNIPVHCRDSFTDRDFENGLIVRPTTEEEVKGIVFSYHSLGRHRARQGAGQ